MYTKRQSYQYSCFPCALQIALVNLGNLRPNIGDRTEDAFNAEMLREAVNPHDLNASAPNSDQIYRIVQRLNLPLGNGFLVAEEDLLQNEATFINRMNAAITQRPDEIGFVIGVNHAFALFRENNEWVLVNPSDGTSERHRNIQANPNAGGGFEITDVDTGDIVIGCTFIMMVSREA